MLKNVLLFFYLLLLSILTIPFFDLPWWLDNLSNLILICLALLMIATPFLIFSFKYLSIIIISPSIFLVFYHLQPNLYLNKPNDIGSSQSYQFIQANLSYYNRYIDNFFEKINYLNSDFIFIFEYSDGNREKFLNLANEKYMYGYDEIQGFPSGIAVISKYPIVYSHLHKSEAKSADILELKFYDKKINKIIHSYLLHPPSPRSFNKWKVRNNTFKKLTTLVEANNSQHILIAGDINVSPWSYNFPKFKNFSACYQGQGYLTSWKLKNNYPKSVITSFIDHCFYNQGFLLKNYNHIDIKDSDHQALVYQLQLVIK